MGSLKPTCHSLQCPSPLARSEERRLRCLSSRPRETPCRWSPPCRSSSQQSQDPPAQKGPTIATKVRRTMSSRVHEAVKAIALCHNVTPVYESNGVTDQAEAEKQFEDSCRVYQASSPDEVSPGQAWPPRIRL